MQASKKISFCTTCCNRLWQLKQTLGNNLSCLDDDLEIALVGYGSTDGVAEWVWEGFREFIDNGKLVFFEVKSEVSWHVSKAKNLAHRISSGNYLFNLDADNFITPADVQNIVKAYDLNIPSIQWSNVWGDGSFGRIGVPRELYFKLGGYDESLLPMGGQDVDLLRRIRSLGIRCARLPAPVVPAIKNSLEDKVLEINSPSGDAASLYETVNKLNLRKSKIRLETEGALRIGGFATYKGLLNGVPVVIDGFDEIRRCQIDDQSRLMSIKTTSLLP